MSGPALCVPPSTRNGRVRKNLSRSSSECDFHPRSRQKPCGGLPGNEADEDVDRPSSELPGGLLSCLSMLELTKADDEQGSFAKHRRSLSRDGSFNRINSSGSMVEILSRIRVPSQRQAMEEMTAAAERVEAQMAARGRTTSWCSPALSCTSDRAPTPLVLEAAQLDAVLRPPPSPNLATAAASSPGGTCSSCGGTPPSGTANQAIANVRRNGNSATRLSCPGGPPATPRLIHAQQPQHRAADATAAASSGWERRPAKYSSYEELPPPASLPRPVMESESRWTGVASAVYLCGTFNGWGERISMGRNPQRLDDWFVVLSLPPGEYAYKFVVHQTDGRIEWRHAADQPTLIDTLGNANNWVRVVDQEAYEKAGRLGTSSSSAASAAALAASPALALTATYDDDVDADFSSEVSHSYLELLFAQEPPPVPAHLLATPFLSSELAACGEEDEGRAYLLPHPPNAINASVHSTLSHICTPGPPPPPPLSQEALEAMARADNARLNMAMMMGYSANHDPWDHIDVDVADITMEVGPTPPGSPHDNEHDEDEDGSAAAAAARRLPPLPPPTSLVTTVRHRQKYVTVELIKPSSSPATS